MIKIFVLLTIMDITQSVDPRNNIFLELMNMSRNALFAGKNVCMPHAPSVGAGIPWVAHPISKCDTCTLFDHHTSGLYNKDTCHNVTIPKLFAINQWCMIPPPTGTLWLCGTSVYSILPSQFNGRCTLVYVLPAIRENTHSTSSSPHLQNSASTNKDGCIPGLTCVQTWWSRTLGALIPSYGVMQALDQVRSLSDSVQKLANDTVLALGNIKDTLASHKMMILQNRVALDYILATQGGACTIIGPECCTGLMDPTENLNKIQQDILGLSAKLHQMTEDNSSWFGNLLGKPWLWIKEIAILLLFLLLAYYLCIHSIKCFFQQMTPASHEEMTVPTRKDYYP